MIPTPTAGMSSRRHIRQARPLGQRKALQYTALILECRALRPSGEHADWRNLSSRYGGREVIGRITSHRAAYERQTHAEAPAARGGYAVSRLDLARCVSSSRHRVSLGVSWCPPERVRALLSVSEPRARRNLRAASTAGTTQWATLMTLFSPAIVTRGQWRMSLPRSREARAARRGAVVVSPDIVFVVSSRTSLRT